MKKWLLPILGIIAVVVVAVAFIGAGSNKSSSSEKQSPETKSADNTKKSEVKTEAKVEVVSKNIVSGHEFENAIYVLGEVKNTGSGLVVSINVSTKFLDASGVVVASGQSDGEVAKILKPGEVAPYEIRIENPPKYEKYEVEASAQPETEATIFGAAALSVLSKSVRNDTSGYLIVSGEVQNLNEKKVDLVSVSVWFLKGGKVVWVSYEYLSGTATELSKNQKGSFEVDLGKKVDYDDYKVQSTGSLASDD